MPQMDGNGLPLLREGLPPVANSVLRACSAVGSWFLACTRSFRVTFCTGLMGLGFSMRDMRRILADCVYLMKLLQQICIKLLLFC
jgi:hypothetical protein